MKIRPGKIPGLFVIEPFVQNDPRGSFVKIFNIESFLANGIPGLEFRESYFSASGKGVLRGMHFQAPPHAHRKLVALVSGRALDVVLDIRKGSPTFGQYESLVLERPVALLIPEGCAHGFLSLEEETVLVYATTTVYQPEYDTGIKYDSFGFDWKIKKPVISDRDSKFAKFADFETPFVYK